MEEFEVGSVFALQASLSATTRHVELRRGRHVEVGKGSLEVGIRNAKRGGQKPDSREKDC